jgi:hypothetical protein
MRGSLRRALFRRLAVIFFLLAAAIPASTGSVAAAVIPGPCTFPGSGHYWNGIVGDPYHFTTVRGVYSVIWSKAKLAICTNPNALDNVGVSYWVALQPAPGNPYHNDDQSIIQVGVIWCDDDAFPSDYPCDNGNETTPRYFWAVGGCGHDPAPHDFFPGGQGALSGGLAFKIERQSGGDYLISINDGVEVHYKSIPASDPGITCWVTGQNLSAAFSCERWDTNDSCGGAGTGYTVAFRDLRIQKATLGSWFVPGAVISGTQYGYPMTDGNCNQTLAEDNCDVRTDLANPPDDIDMWTVN